MLLVAYRHGLRASELVDLRWDQVDFRTATLHVRRAKRRRGANVRICIGLSDPPEGATCNDAVEADSRSKSSGTTRPKARKAPSTHVSGADFPAFIVIDDKGNDVFKDINLG